MFPSICLPHFIWHGSVCVCVPCTVFYIYRLRIGIRESPLFLYMAVGQNQWYHFGVCAPPILVYFSWDWDVHWGYDLDFDPQPHRAESRALRFSAPGSGPGDKGVVIDAFSAGNAMRSSERSQLGTLENALRVANLWIHPCRIVLKEY